MPHDWIEYRQFQACCLCGVIRRADDGNGPCKGWAKVKPRKDEGAMKQEEVFAAVAEERRHQDRKWGKISEHPHEVGGWILIMEKLLADARAAWASTKGDQPALAELRKAVAVGVACLEQHGCPLRRDDHRLTADDRAAWE